MVNLRSEYVLLYDISDSKKRTKVFNQLKDIGLVPIQKSVFWGYLNSAEYYEVCRVADSTNKENDKVVLLKISLRTDKNFKFWGYDSFSFVEENNVII